MEKAFVMFVFLFGPLFLIASVAVAFLGYSWWGGAALVAYIFLYFGFQASSSLAGARATTILVLLVITVCLYAFDPFSMPYLMASIMLFVCSLWCVRMVYVGSTHFYRAMALRNARLFDLLSAGIEMRRVR